MKRKLHRESGWALLIRYRKTDDWILAPNPHGQAEGILFQTSKKNLELTGCIKQWEISHYTKIVRVVIAEQPAKRGKRK